MDNSKSNAADETKTTVAAAVDAAVSNEENLNEVVSAAAAAGGVAEGNGNGNGNRGRGARTPFTNLSQVDADLALARTLQEQERAYMMLRMNGNGGYYGGWQAENFMDDEDDEFEEPSEEESDGSDHGDEEEEEEEEEGEGEDGEEYEEEEEEEEEEDVFDVHAHLESEEDENQGAELDPAAFSSDEAYARALQEAEDIEMSSRLLALAGINDMVIEEAEDDEDHDGNSQDTWEDVDPDELSYEELIALGEVVGTESRGLSTDLIASLPSMKWKAQSSETSSGDSCVICRLDYEDDDTLTVLSCKHSYHPECITNWLKINKVCPVCSAEVSTSGTSK